MGEVYVAVDSSLEREVAIKVLSDRYAQDVDIRRRFTREALAAARLSGQPHVVTIFDVGEHDSRPFIVMAYMAGGSVAERLRSGPITPGRALDWLEQSAAALDAAHRVGIVHRDVKPGNLLLDSADVVHVGDFGIARAAGLDSLTSPGTVLGTAGYLSPEQAAGMSATAASDRYALGIVAFELLTGERPFAADSTTGEAFAHAHAPPPSIHGVNPDLPQALDPVFERALAKSPDDRPRSSDELVDDLRHAFWEAESPTRSLPLLPPPPGPRSGERPTVVRRQRRARFAGLGIAALALGLAGAAAATYLAISGGEKGAAPTSPTRPAVVRETVTHTVTTTTAPTTAPTTPADERTLAQLNNDGYALLRAGNARDALPLLERAVAGLQGSGSLDEAYASYNLAWARFSLGRCDGVLDLLRRSEQIQGQRDEIDRLRTQAEQRCTSQAGGNGNGNGRGHGKKNREEG